MPIQTVERSAPGKIILCGEHSVVYGHPAIAVPVSDMRSHARVVPGRVGQGLHLGAPDLKQDAALSTTTYDHPLGRLARLVLLELGAPEPDAVLTVSSDLPMASGMGSGASVAVAAARALSAALGSELSSDAISRIAFEVEKIHHGTPSGIDNTVIAWEQPVYFVRDIAPDGRTGETTQERPEIFRIRTPFKLLIASSGIASSTKEAVAEVRRRWTETPAYYDVVFNCIGAIARAARAAVEQGAIEALGTLINENHELLVKMGVSLVQLDRLIAAARHAGALGAKLTGSGQGGNIIALVENETAAAVREAVIEAGATSVWETAVGRHDG